MALSSFVQTAFFGGEISKSAQGRMELPSYKVSMNVCFNGIPVESGAWMRRPGTRHVAPTRGGGRGRLISFSFAQNYPYIMEFTELRLRFTTGPDLVMTNDEQVIVSISSATPAVIETTTAHGWSTAQSVAFNSLGVNNPLLQNRQFSITYVDPTHFSIADLTTGSPIDGSTLGDFVSGNVTRIYEIITTYQAGELSNLRSVQAETRTVLLNGDHPKILQVDTLPTDTLFATFNFDDANFIDGPYLDPIEGSYITSSALNGVVTLTLSFSDYDSSKAYNIGDFVTSGGAGYRSLTALNQGNLPSTHPANWAAVNAGAPVNDGKGFLASDIGRLIRLFSEPQVWSVNGTYARDTVVAYSDGSGGYTYWVAIAAITQTIYPGTDATKWGLMPEGARWTWAEITGVSGSGLIAPATAIGDLAFGGGLAAAFDGTTSKVFTAAANYSANITTYPAWSVAAWTQGAVCQYGGVAYQAQYSIIPASSFPAYNSTTYYASGNVITYNGFVYRCLAAIGGIAPPHGTYWLLVYAVSTAAPAGPLWVSFATMSSPTQALYVGQHYGAAIAIQSATLYPTSDIGLGNSPSLSFTINLRASNSSPTSSSNGTLLASTNIYANPTTPVTLTSTDQTSTWTYVWFEILHTFSQPLPDDGSHIFTSKIGAAQAQFYSPNVNNGSVVTAQIRGPALLYSQTIRTWRLGVYSDTTGWPTCGCYHEGRIWLGGVVSNRFDGSVSNGFNGVQLDFAPTGPNGSVAGNNAISYVCTGEDSNQILWMTPDQQGILFGTKAGEWLISAPSAGPLAPTNIKAVRVTKIGCADIEPRRAEHTLLFVQKFGRKIMEYFADVFSGKFTAPNLSERAKHLTVRGIAELAYQQELVPTMWARRTDGALIGATYKRDTLTTSQGPTIIGWHRHQLGSGRVVESLCVGPSVDGTLDTLSLITNDVATGIRHIEVMTDLLDEGFALTDCWFLDDAIIPSSTVVQLSPTGGAYGSLLCNGLAVHEGKSVTAFIAGLDCGDFTVSGGSITIPFGDGVSGGAGSGLLTADLVNSFATLPAVIGFTYNSDGQLVRPVTQADTGAQSGPGFAKLGRQHRIAAQMYGMVNGSISFGTDFNTLDPAKLRYANDVPYTVQEQWSGIWRDQGNSNIDFDGMISWRISRPYPAFMIAVGGFMSKADA